MRVRTRLCALCTLQGSLPNQEIKVITTRPSAKLALMIMHLGVGVCGCMGVYVCLYVCVCVCVYVCVCG